MADIGDASKIPLPVDISITADDKYLWVNTWNDGTTHLFDVSNPHAPKQVFEQKIGEQLNMVSQSWDGKRVYFTSSLLANWDKTAPGGGDLQFFKLYEWDGTKLTQKFAIDFLKEKLPGGIGDQIESYLSGNADAIADQADGLTDKIKGMFSS